MSRFRCIAPVVIILMTSGCISPQIKLFSDGTEPLREFVVQGEQQGKVLVISVSGFISDRSKKGVFRETPSVVRETVAQLRKAEKDRDIKAVLLKIDSPGGTITASDILYREIVDYKQRTGTKVVAVMMDVAASGGYYIALAADHIMAHPTTITGSIGAIFLHPKIYGLMDKIGVTVQVNKSGENKDMGSPFRKTTKDEQQALQDLIDTLGDRFIALVAKRRQLDPDNLDRVHTARIFLAREAHDMGLIDEIGYLPDAVGQSRKMGGLPENSEVVIYRRTEHPDENIYNAATSRYAGNGAKVPGLGLPDALTDIRTGFYYLWPAAVNYP